MFPDVDSRHLHAVVVLAQELNFTRAAQILHISQPALSKQITELEEQHGLHLFVREKGRIVELTEAGRVFVQEARTALFHAERAIHLAHAAHQGVETVLLIGHSHYADRACPLRSCEQLWQRKEFEATPLKAFFEPTVNDS